MNTSYNENNEKYNSSSSTNFDCSYSDLLGMDVLGLSFKYYNDAKDEYEREKYDGACGYLRKAIEVALRCICKQNNIEVDRTNEEHIPGKLYAQTIEEMIKVLYDCGIIKDNLSSKLHKIRKAGNEALHSSGTIVDKSTCMEAIKLFETAFSVLCHIDKTHSISATEDYFDILLKHPDYYGSNRPYLGKWLYVHSISDLRSESEYCRLEEEANSGNIDAMLSIASGFIPRNNLFLNDFQMLCMPKYKNRKDDKEHYQKDAFDTRYYYWILKACNKTYIDFITHKNVSAILKNKFILTALLDAIKFKFATLGSINYYVTKYDYTSDSCEYKNQYEEIKEMYGESIYSIGNIYEFAYLFDKIMKYHDYSFDFIAGTHNECNMKQVKFILYCYSIYRAMTNPNDWSSYVQHCEDMSIEHNDFEKYHDIRVLEKYISDSLCKKYYEWIYHKLDKYGFVLNNIVNSAKGLNKISFVNKPFEYIANWLNNSNGNIEISSIEANLHLSAITGIENIVSSNNSSGFWNFKEITIYFYFKPNAGRNYFIGWKSSQYAKLRRFEKYVGDTSFKNVSDYINSLKSQGRRTVLDVDSIKYFNTMDYTDYCRAVIVER